MLRSLTVIFSVFSLTLTLTTYGNCELSSGLTVSGIYDDNIFNNSLGNSDYMSRIGFYIGGVGKYTKSDFSYSYTGDFHNFSKYGELNFSHHNLGTSYKRNIGKSRDFLYTGIEVSLRINHPDYRYYDYSKLRIYIFSKYYLTEATMARGGYEFSLRDYRDSSSQPFSYKEHYLFLQVNRFFEAGLTLRAELDVGYKDFAGGMSGDTVLDLEDVGQAVGVLRIAKSLGENMGLSLQGILRGNFHGGSGDAPTYTEFYDEGFEDQYSYSGEEIRLTFTRIFPLDLRLRSSLNHVVKRYGEDYPFIEAGGATSISRTSRTDRVSGISAFLNWGFDFRFPFSQVGLDLGYSYLSNRSNIPYYSWDGGTFSADLSFGF